MGAEPTSGRAVIVLFHYSRDRHVYCPTEASSHKTVNGRTWLINKTKVTQ